MSKPKLSTLAAALVLSLAPMAASQAAIITYTLQNLAFSDGATTSGFFKFDTATNTVANYSLTTTNGSLSGFTYVDATSKLIPFGANDLIFAEDIDGNVSISRYLRLAIGPDFGTVGNFSLNLSNSYECMNCGSIRYAISGSLVGVQGAVPEPGTLALLLPALAGVGAVARRRKAAQA